MQSQVTWRKLFGSVPQANIILSMCSSNFCRSTEWTDVSTQSDQIFSRDVRGHGSLDLDTDLHISFISTQRYLCSVEYVESENQCWDSHAISIYTDVRRTTSRLWCNIPNIRSILVIDWSNILNDDRYCVLSWTCPVKVMWFYEDVQLTPSRWEVLLSRWRRSDCCRSNRWRSGRSDASLCLSFPWRSSSIDILYVLDAGCWSTRYKEIASSIMSSWWTSRLSW